MRAELLWVKEYVLGGVSVGVSGSVGVSTLSVRECEHASVSVGAGGQQQACDSAEGSAGQA